MKHAVINFLLSRQTLYRRFAIGYFGVLGMFFVVPCFSIAQGPGWKQGGLTLVQVWDELTMQANQPAQNGSLETFQRASDFVGQAHNMSPADGGGGRGYMFFATPEQEDNPNMSTGTYSNGAGMNVPSPQAIANSANRDKAYRDAYTKLTWCAAVGAAGIAALGLAAAIPGARLLRRGGA